MAKLFPPTSTRRASRPFQDRFTTANRLTKAVNGWPDYPLLAQTLNLVVRVRKRLLTV